MNFYIFIVFLYFFIILTNNRGIGVSAYSYAIL